MKTIDEVIAELEDEGVFADALNYLKTYRENQHAYEENSRKAEEARELYLEAVKNCEVAENKYKRLYEEASQNFVDTSQNDPDGDHQQLLKCQALLQDFYRNDPISWDELKTMKGKPVWIEQDGFTPQWELVTRIGKVHFYAVDAVFFETEYDIERYGKTWKAYRKERE